MARSRATTTAVWPRGGTVGASVGIRWICVPSRSSQVNPAQVAGGSTSREAEQRPELDRALDLRRRDLDPDVVQHQNKERERAAPTTIAVDQVTASAVISMSSP